MDVAGLGIDGGDDPVRGGLAGDPPGAVLVSRLDVLAGDQGQQADGIGRFAVELEARHRVEHGRARR